VIDPEVLPVGQDAEVEDGDVDDPDPSRPRLMCTLVSVLVFFFTKKLKK
jgi:hypothetical protein